MLSYCSAKIHFNYIEELGTGGCTAVEFVPCDPKVKGS